MSINEIRSTIQSPYSSSANELLKAAGIKYSQNQARLLNLAYAFVREVPYRVAEPTARPLFDSMGHYQDTFIKNIAKLANHLNREYVPRVEAPEKGILQVVVDKLTGKVDPPPAPRETFVRNPATEETIRAWLAVPETDARKERRLAREAKSRQAREARRQAFIQTALRVAQARQEAV
jgi:hypothetical protein